MSFVATTPLADLGYGGAEARGAAFAADAVVDYVNGFALAEAGGPLGGAGDRRGLLELLEDRPKLRHKPCNAGVL